MVVSGITDIGQVRANNQDCYYISPDNKWVVVADGMGGHNGGETASRVAIDSIKEAFENSTSDIEETMSDAIKSANSVVYDMSLTDPKLSGMGTTVILCCFKDDSAIIAHVGDSRAYHISGNKIIQITKDHSIVQNLIDSGTITTEQAQNHPNKNQITRAVGTENTVMIDFNTVKTKSGECILLCTDGLTSLVDEKTILKEISDNEVDKAAKNLILLANENGGYDNITIVLAQI